MSMSSNAPPCPARSAPQSPPQSALDQGEEVRVEVMVEVRKEVMVEVEQNLLARKGGKEDLGGLVGLEEVLQETPIEDIILRD